LSFRFYIAIIILVVMGYSCAKEETILLPATEAPLLSVPSGFPEPDFPEDNAFTEARWKLGKKLFFDPVMSRTNEVSCASCHLPEKAFSDTVAFSPGVDGRAGVRNAPSLANVAYHPYFTREGGVPTLEMQILVPIQEHNEFDANILDIARRLRDNPEYQALSAEAYNREPDHYVITRALATFERSLLSGNSRYDKYTRDNNPNTMSEQEIEGMDLFFSDRTQCTSCHGGFNFTDYSFENNGLYNSYKDEGRFRLTNDEADRARFKVPSLRNVELTAPYMHDGSVKTLEDVVSHYNSGGKDHPHKSEFIRPLNLTGKEQEALLAFLKTLSDEDFINNKNFKP
jgi:cytochrome c peroxidase